MRKLIIVTGHSCLDSGGVGTHIRVLTDSLSKAGIEHSLILGTGKKSKIYYLINKMLDRFFRLNGNYYSTNLLSSIDFFKSRIENEIIKIGTDYSFLIHCHDRQSLIAAIQLKNKYDIKAIQTIHAPFRQQYEDHLEMSKTLIPYYIRALDTSFLNKADGFIAVDELQKDILINDYSSLINNKYIKIIHNAVEEQLLNSPNKLDCDDFHVVARYLHKKNGVEYAIRAFHKFYESKFYDNSKLIILGEGGELERLQKLVNEFKLSNYIEFKGAVNRKVCLEYISRAKSSLVPSIPVGIYIEATSLTMLESLALKTPLIASNIGGMKEVLDGKDAAFLVEPENIEDIYLSFIEISKGNYINKVANGFELIKSGYTSTQWLNKHIEFYSKY
ncbi:glycosyltransferase family 4 protein [Photobacterium damselae]|uniref:glycosyltransferase family 4 protein n=1 Tax=Photobacterium damselae TaxID=38293 RepID=UPI000E006999|nr:glycosyltransferase family 4 protein [Photobacterium damselae]SUB65679.1 Glycogen synthase [Photobacterium damselae]